MSAIAVLGLLLLMACSSEDASSSPETARAAEAPTEPKVEAQPEAEGPFRMTVQDAFRITGRGMVVTGRVESGTVVVGQALCLERVDGSERTVQVTGIEQFREIRESASKGDNVGLMLDGVASREDVNRQDVLSEEC